MVLKTTNKIKKKETEVGLPGKTLCSRWDDSKPPWHHANQMKFGQLGTLKTSIDKDCRKNANFNKNNNKIMLHLLYKTLSKIIGGKQPYRRSEAVNIGWIVHQTAVILGDKPTAGPMNHKNIGDQNIYMLRVGDLKLKIPAVSAMQA